MTLRQRLPIPGQSDSKWRGTLKNFLGRKLVRYLGVSVVVVAVGIVGILLLATSSATTSPIAVEAEDGSISSPATKVADSSASNNAAVLFKPVSTTAPTGFVQVCGTQLCINGQPFTIHGATAYGTYSSPATEVALAQQAKVNTLAIVEFESQHHVLASLYGPDPTTYAQTWNQVDAFIGAARQAGLHVVLTLSSYAQSLQAAGQTPTTTDWGPFLSYIANRTNTVTGVQYKNDPTIAMVQLWGEICYPGEADTTCPAGTSGTATDMQNFYHRSITEWQADAPSILISTGGFSHVNTTNASGIPWQAIESDPANPICELEVNSPNDVTGAVGKFTQYCQQLGKPWYLAAWSSCYQDTGYPYYLADDSAMAQHAQDMYNLEKGLSPASYAAAGDEFWNLRDQGVSAGHCDLGPAYPLTWSVIQNNAPK